MEDELSQKLVENWISTIATGTFHYSKVLDGQVASSLYPHLRVILSRCIDKGVAVKVNGRDGFYRPIDRGSEEIVWWESDGEESNLRLPLGLNKYCRIYKPALLVIAGEWNAGKTALVLNIINHNLELWKNNIYLWVSEGAEMLKNKFSELTPPIPIPPTFVTKRKMSHFEDEIKPDALNVIDYLRADMSQAYAVSNQLLAIHEKLRTGIAVVAMQKPRGEGRELAFGGDSTAFEPTLYVSIYKGYLKFTKIKVPKMLDFDPYKLKIEFKIRNGVNLVDIHEVIE